MSEFSPPKADVNTDANLRIHLRVLIGVLYEMTKVCGVEIGDDLDKGVLERDVIERITITFKDKNNIGKARVIFKINWDKLEQFYMKKRIFQMAFVILLILNYLTC